MINKKILYNTSGLGADQELVSATISHIDGCSKSFASPCIINKKELETESDIISVLAPFGIVDCTRPFTYFKAYKNNIKLNNTKPITNNRIQSIERFDFKKLNKISEYIKEEGSASFSFMAYSAYGSGLASGRVVTHFLDAFDEEIIKRYRYHSRLYFDHSSSGKGNVCGDFRYILHFLSIDNCNAIFNRYKVDGMGVIFQIVSLENCLYSGELSPVYTLSVILSNYKENIFVLDGVDLREKIAHKPDDLEIAKAIINNSLKNNKEYIIRENKTKEKSEGFDSNKWAEVLIAPRTNATYTNSTSTASYYYTNS